ncbi:PilN domain-containing protein [Ferdinandcohnia sp. Marseille-Q9671]
MLVDINLLPRREYRNRANLLIILLIALVLIAGFLFVFLQYKKVTSLEEQLKNRIVTLQETRAAEEQKYASANNSSNVIQLEKTVEWADGYFAETVPILNHLTELLPERGFVQSFSYVDNGAVSFQVQFDTNTQIAHYLALLNESPYIKSAILFSISTSPLSEENQATGQISENQENVANNNPATQPEGEQTNNRTAQIEDDNVLPRYLAQFEVKIDKSEFTLLQKEGN